MRLPALICLLLTLGAPPATAGEKSLWDIAARLHAKQFVDLTHAFSPSSPHGAGLPAESTLTLYHYDPGVGTLGAGGLIYQYTLPGQWGTHVDAPNHFHRTGRSLDRIPPKQMLLPLVVIDVHQQAARNPDYTLRMADIRAWEKKHGAVPRGAFVAMRTDWSKRWPDAAKLFNRDDKGVGHYPGWSLETLKYLYEERGITASGHETSDTDRGIDASRFKFDLEAYVLAHAAYQIELMTNLDQLPEQGALIIATWPKPEGGSGFPARVFAILP